MPTHEFSGRSAKQILEAYGYVHDQNGYIIDEESSERVTAMCGEELTVEAFAGITEHGLIKDTAISVLDRATDSP